MCRISRQITGKPASATALKSHCDGGLVFNSIRSKAAGRVRQHRQQSLGFARHSYFLHEAINMRAAAPETI